MIIDSPIISGSYLSTGSLSQTGNVSITGSLTATAGISGSFSGSGADLFGIPASGITGLNLSQISSGSVSASISPNQGLLINTSVSASNFTGSFTGSLTGIATSASYASFALTSSYSLGGSGFPFSGSAVITGSLLVSGSAEITGSLSVSGSISASLFGTASQATSASYALTASYLLGYISPFPFTGSAAITGSLIVTGSVAISTLVTSSGVRYVIADQNGLLSAQTASAAIFTTQQVVSTAGQTTFPITNGYATGYVTVFVNGTKLSADEYIDTSGTNIVFLTGSTAGDNVEFQKYLPAAGVSNNTLRSTNYFTATTGQTNFSVNYTPGLLDIFYNGAKLDNTEYTAANGTSITLATASAAGDRLEVDVYSYQVGAFSGIGGTGAANQLAYFNTSNSITGSNAFTVSGSAVIITGSLIVSGSGTFTNIGPAVFSGSVTAVGGFSGSFSGNADSASLAQNSLLLQGTGSIGFATTASLLAVSSSQQQISASLLNVVANYATTGSNSFRADQSITGSLVVSSTITAQTLVVQTVTSSIVYSSGSNLFGNSLSNTQTFTGSVNITGSLALVGNISGNAITLTSALDGTSATFSGNNHSLASNNTLRFTDTDTATEANQQIGKIEFYSSDSSTPGAGVKAYIGAFAQDTTPDAYLSFATQDGSATPNPVERLRISSEGLATFSSSVGIGGVSATSVGGTAFMVYDSATPRIRLTNSTTGTTSTDGGELSLFNSDFNIENRESGSMNFYVNGSKRFDIASTGAATFSSTITATLLLLNDSSPKITFSPASYSGAYRTVLGTRAGAEGILQLGNNNPNYIVGGNTGVGGALHFYVNATSDFITSTNGTLSLVLASSGAATFYSSITTNANFINSGPVYSTTGNVGNLLFTNTYPSNYNVAQIASVLDGYYYAAKLIFRTADSANANLLVDRLTITSDGNIAIGTFATAGDKYFGYSHTNGGWGAGASGLRFESVAVGGNYSQNIYIRTHYYNADSRNAIYCRYDGNVYNFSNSTAWQTTSDIRIKENIRPINNALDKINALNPSHFEYKNKLGQTKTGFVAQEFEQIFPGHVSEGLPNEDYKEYFKEGEMMKSIDADLIPYLVKAIQEQNVLIQELQEKLQRNNIN